MGKKTDVDGKWNLPTDLALTSLLHSLEAGREVIRVIDAVVIADRDRAHAVSCSRHAQRYAFSLLRTDRRRHRRRSGSEQDRKRRRHSSNDRGRSASRSPSRRKSPAEANG